MTLNTNLIILVVAVVSLAPVLWSVLDVASRAEAAFLAAPGNRTLWLLLPVALLPLGLGWLVSAAYLLAIRPRLTAEQVATPERA